MPAEIMRAVIVSPAPLRPLCGMKLSGMRMFAMNVVESIILPSSITVGSLLNNPTMVFANATKSMLSETTMIVL